MNEAQVQAFRAAVTQAAADRAAAAAAQAGGGSEGKSEERMSMDQFFTLRNDTIARWGARAVGRPRARFAHARAPYLF